jgi:hypothetical protein
MCPIPNYSITIGKKKRLRTVSNGVIHCSSDKVGAVYLVPGVQSAG